MTEEAIIRVSCRVVLIDNEDRVLLLEHAIDNPRDAAYPSVWVPPGGGTEDGESHEDTALRELWEETGLRLSEVGPLIWIRKSTFRIPNGRLLTAVEEFYVCRIHSYEVGEHLNLDEAERPIVLGQRWWTVAEMESYSGIFAPRRFVELLKPILRGEYPREPIGVEDV
jgi:8-oxo-dGTP pyrophosphatase MutT (NUDIX family)